MTTKDPTDQPPVPDDLEIGLGNERDAAGLLSDEAEDGGGLRPTSPTDDPALRDAPAVAQLTVSVVNRAMIQDGEPDEGVAACEVAIGPLRKSTNSFGNAIFDLSGLGDGDHPLRVQAPDSTEELAGPGVPADTSRQRIWCPLEGQVKLAAGRIVGAQPGNVLRLIGNRLRIALHPSWMRTRFFNRRPAAPDMIVIHHTASNSVRSDVTHLLSSGEASVHYLVTPVGDVCKFADESVATFHAGASFWRGAEGMNAHSIGIEIAHANGEYPAAQIDAVVELVKRIHKAFPAIPPGRVVAHSDIAIKKPGEPPPQRHGRKSTDPGSLFPWERIEALGLGFQPKAGTVDPEIYGGFFRLLPEGMIRRGDRDDRQVYGGEQRPGLTGIVRAIQEDLARIGYLTRPIDGIYGEVTAFAAQMFQQHMFSGSRRLPGIEQSGDGNIDRATAEMIKRVLGEVSEVQVASVSISVKDSGSGQTFDAPMPLTIRQQSSRIVAKGLTDSVIELQPGRYLASVQLPDGTQLVDQIDISAGRGNIQLIADAPAYASPAILSKRTPSGAVGDALEAVSVSAPAPVLGTAEEVAALARQAGSVPSQATEVRGEPASIIRAVVLSVDRLGRFQATGDRLPTSLSGPRCTAVKVEGRGRAGQFVLFETPDDDARPSIAVAIVTDRSMEFRATETPTLRVTPILGDARANALLSYLGEQSYSNVSTFSKGDVEAGFNALLESKVNDPSGAIIGGYGLLAVKRYEALNALSENLTRVADWSPDAFAIHGETKARAGDHAAAAEAFLTAIGKGVPLFVPGLLCVEQWLRFYLGRVAAVDARAREVQDWLDNISQRIIKKLQPGAYITSVVAPEIGA